MVQREPEEHQLEDAQQPPTDHEPGGIDEEYLEKLRNDPNVIVHRRTTTEPFVPKIILKEPVDVLWLIGRREQEWVDDEGDMSRT